MFYLIKWQTTPKITKIGTKHCTGEFEDFFLTASNTLLKINIQV